MKMIYLILIYSIVCSSSIYMCTVSHVTVQVSVRNTCSVSCSVLTSVYLLCRYNLKKLTYEERKAKLIDRLNALNSATADGSDEDEDDE